MSTLGHCLLPLSTAFNVDPTLCPGPSVCVCVGGEGNWGFNLGSTIP
jgi:hypothetical protein